MAAAYETQALRATYYDMEPRPGTCAICGRAIQQQRLWEACRYMAEAEDGRHVVNVHQTCAGVESKSKIGGGRKIVRAPEIKVRVKVAVLHDA